MRPDVCGGGMTIIIEDEALEEVDMTEAVRIMGGGWFEGPFDGAQQTQALYDWFG